MVRRLGGALASGASMVGWHSWMAGDSAGFEGHGLRWDGGGWDSPPEDATQRLSWFAYQRFASLFAGATSGSMVLPSVASRAELETFLASTGAHPFVVFCYEGAFSPPDRTVSFRYAWLVLRDPSLPPSSRLHLYAMWANPASSGVAVAVPLISGPSGIALGLGSLPYEAPVSARSTDVGLASMVEFLLPPEDGPVLLLSEEVISWSVSP